EKSFRSPGSSTRRALANDCGPTRYSRKETDGDKRASASTASLHLYSLKEYYFELCGRGCDSLYNISRSPALSSYVTTLVLRAVHGYRKFPDSDIWVDSIFQPGDPGNAISLSSDTSYYNNDQVSKELLPYSEWMALSEERKEALYQEYEADRKKAHDELRDMTNTAPRSTTASTAAIDQFYWALKALPNLKALYHEPAFLYDDYWACRWRDLYLHPMSLVGHTDYWACRWRDLYLHPMSLVGHTDYWACRWRDLYLHPMSLVGHTDYWACRWRDLYLHPMSLVGHTDYCEDEDAESLHVPDAAQADREAYSADTIQGQGQFYGEQLQLMRYALVSLTHLDYVVSDEDKLEGCLGIAGNLVTGFLIATEKLEDLRLVFGRLVNSVFQPLSGYDERNRSQGSIRLLENLTLYSPWTAIRRVELEIATDKDTLLHLTRMTLVRLGDPLNNWELALTEIGQGLSLTSLALSDLFDFTEEWGRGVQGRMLFKSEDSSDLGGIQCLKLYYYIGSAIIPILELRMLTLRPIPRVSST
ncbi:hypothetical protein PMIN01_11873, partial [Paraphaeosphaeria minitans]